MVTAPSHQFPQAIAEFPAFTPCKFPPDSAPTASQLITCLLVFVLAVVAWVSATLLRQWAIKRLQLDAATGRRPPLVVVEDGHETIEHHTLV